MRKILYYMKNHLFQGDVVEEPVVGEEGEAGGDREEGRKERRGGEYNKSPKRCWYFYIFCDRASAGTGQVSPGSQGKARMRRRWGTSQSMPHVTLRILRLRVNSHYMLIFA